jgi:hypothetical protein
MESRKDEEAMCGGDGRDALEGGRVEGSVSWWSTRADSPNRLRVVSKRGVGCVGGWVGEE